jgi:hypothetical protein
MLGQALVAAAVLWASIAPSACAAIRATPAASPLPACHAQEAAPSSPASSPEPDQAASCCSPCDGYLVSAAPQPDAPATAALPPAELGLRPLARLDCGLVLDRPPDPASSPYLRENRPLLI